MKSELAEAKPVSGEDIKIEFMALDLTSLASARDFAKAYLARNLPLHLLILNAGIAMIDPLRIRPSYPLEIRIFHLVYRND